MLIQRGSTRREIKLTNFWRSVISLAIQLYRRRHRHRRQFATQGVQLTLRGESGFMKGSFPRRPSTSASQQAASFCSGTLKFCNVRFVSAANQISFRYCWLDVLVLRIARSLADLPISDCDYRSNCNQVNQSVGFTLSPKRPVRTRFGVKIKYVSFSHSMEFPLERTLRHLRVFIEVK